MTFEEARKLAAVDRLIGQVDALQHALADVTRRLEAIEARPRPGRPRKDAIK